MTFNLLQFLILWKNLEDAPHPHSSRLLARQMAQLIAYLRKNGGFELRDYPGTGKLFICFYFKRNVNQKGVCYNASQEAFSCVTRKLS